MGLGHRHVAPWWRHQMKTFSALLAICAGKWPVPGEFPAQRPVTQSFDVFFDLRPNIRLSKQCWGWWFETPSWPLWRHCNIHAKHGNAIFRVPRYFIAWSLVCIALRGWYKLHCVISRYDVTYWLWSKMLVPCRCMNYWWQHSPVTSKHFQAKSRYLS